MTQSVAYRRSPVTMPTLELATVVPLLPRLRCGACRGRIALDPPTHLAGALYCLLCACRYNLVVERVAVLRPLTPEEARPKRGRPPKAPRAVASNPPRLCADCGVRRAKHNRPRCPVCSSLRRVDSSALYARMLHVLGNRTPMAPYAVAQAVGCGRSTLTRMVRAARDNGVPIETVGRRYRLAEVTP